MVGKGEGLTGKLREAHSFFPLLPFKTAAGTGVLLLMAESAQAADYLPVCCVYALCVCVCLYAECAHCLVADCMLAKTLLCVITGETKPTDENLPVTTKIDI